MVHREGSPIKIFRKEISEVMGNSGKVLVTYVEDKQVRTLEGKLQGFSLACIDIDNSNQNGHSLVYMPTLGNGCAVQKMTDEEGRSLYENNMIDPSYCSLKVGDIIEIRKKFGLKIDERGPC